MKTPKTHKTGAPQSLLTKKSAPAPAKWKLAAVKTKPPTVMEILDVIGMEAIGIRIECGETQREIAASLGFDVMNLNRWLNSRKNALLSAHAREASAEAWLDRGMDAVTSAMNKSSGIDPAAARALEQHCARRAAIRNPKYRDSYTVEQTLTLKPMEEINERIAEIEAQMRLSA